jgi:excisionase family DNA binding protein
MERNSHHGLLTLSQAAELTRLPVKRLRWAVRDGELPAYRFGAWRRIRCGDLEAWIQSHRVEPAMESPPA